MTGPMKDGGISIDFEKFNRAFFEYALKTAPAAAEKGMWEGLRALKADCDNVVPKTPLLEGNLRGDHTLILEGVTTSKVEEITGGKGRDHKKGGSKPAERFGAKDIIAKLIFRMPYAAKWHEAVNKKVNWSEKGAGPKYVEVKLMAFGKKYFGLVAQRVREATGK
jgi:hypothetical protein